MERSNNTEASGAIPQEPVRRLSLTRSQITFAACGLMIALAVLLTGSLISDIRREYEEHRKEAALGAERKWLQVVCFAVEGVYSDTGRLVHSIRDLESTQYYPFESTNSVSTDGKSLAIIVSGIDPHTIKCSGVCADSSGWRRTIETWYFDARSPREQTQAMLNAFVQGVDVRQIKVGRVRDQLVHSHSSAVAMGMRGLDTPARTMDRRPFRDEMPCNDVQLIAYRNWLCQMIGTRELRDAWGGPIVLRIKHGQLEATSPGPDGQPDTADDVVASGPLRR